MFLCKQAEVDMNSAATEVQLLPFQPWGGFLFNTNLSSNPKQLPQSGVYQPG